VTVYWLLFAVGYGESLFRSTVGLSFFTDFLALTGGCFHIGVYTLGVLQNLGALNSKIGGIVAAIQAASIISTLS